MQEFLAPDVEAAEKATAVALGRKLTKKKASGPPPSQVTLVALNGNGVSGSAANACFLLGQNAATSRCFRPDNAKAERAELRLLPQPDLLPPEAPGAQAAAQKLASARRQRRRPEDAGRKLSRLTGEAMLAVVVGQTFHGTLAPAPVDRTPKKRQPPVVITDPATSLPARPRGAASKVDFPLMLPTVLERSSSPDPTMPVRAYETDGHKTVRLTYRFFADGVHQYWGIQQTDWEDAPALAEANQTHDDRGAQVRPLLLGPEAAHGRPAREGRDLLGRQHAARQALERDDDRDRQGPAAPRIWLKP